jgi:serine/threonine-protein kinase
MSPEQARGLKTVDGRADLYSLGLSAYTMLSGQLAINGESFGDILLKICAEPLPRLLAAAPWLPDPMEAWFQRTCARDPAARCQSAQEFIDTLRMAVLQAPAVAGALAAVPRTAPGGNVALSVHPATVARSVNQSGVNMAITAAGIPRRNTGLPVAGGAMGVLAILVAGLVVANRPHSHEGSDGPADPRSAAASAGPLSPSSSSAAPIEPAPPTPPVASETPGSTVTPRPVVMHPPVPRPADIPPATVRAGRPAVRLTSVAPAPTAPASSAPPVAAVPVPAVPPATPPATAASPRINLGY